MQLFNVAEEANVPTWFSSMLLFGCAYFCWKIFENIKNSPKNNSAYWKSLAFIFAYLSLDESAGIHDRLSVFMEHKYLLKGYLFYPWVLVAIPLVMVILLFFSRFLINLESPLKKRLISAGALYLIGAIGIEMIGGNHEFLRGNDNLHYHLLVTIEEFFEMTGSLLFFHAFGTYYLNKPLSNLPQGSL